MLEAAEQDAKPTWREDEHGDHVIDFGEMRASVSLKKGMTLIEIVVDGGDGPTVVYDYVGEGTARLEAAQAHALEMARTWLKANLAALDHA
jgi:hypothetical protein